MAEFLIKELKGAALIYVGDGVAVVVAEILNGSGLGSVGPACRRTAVVECSLASIVSPLCGYAKLFLVTNSH